MSDSVGTAFIEMTLDGNKYTAELQKVQTKTAQATKEMASQFGSLDTSLMKLTQRFIGLAAGYLALSKMKSVVEDMSKLAGQYQALGVALDQVAKNTNTSGAALKSYSDRLTEIGLTAIGARKSILQMAQSQIDVSKAPALAEVAKNFAAVQTMKGQTTTPDEAMTALIRAAMVGRARQLTQAGVPVDFTAAIQKAQAATPYKLTVAEKEDIRVDEILKKSTTMADQWKAFSDTLPGQEMQMEERLKSLKTTFGEVFLGANIEGLRMFNVVLESLEETLKRLSENGQIFVA